MIFQDRSEAGKKLAKKLKQYVSDVEVVVGVSSGGIAVAEPIARAFNLPLEIVIAQKLFAPGNPDLGIGAVSNEGECMYNPHLITLLSISKEYVKGETLRQREKALQQMSLFAQGGSRVDLRGKRVILVDEGIATGATIRVAIGALRSCGVERIILAVPVAAPATIDKLGEEVDEIVCLFKPGLFESIGAFYRCFEPVEDDEVLAILRREDVLVGN